MVVKQNLAIPPVNGLRQAIETGKHIHHKMCGHGGESMVQVWVLNDKDGKKTGVFFV